MIKKKVLDLFMNVDRGEKGAVYTMDSMFLMIKYLSFLNMHCKTKLHLLATAYYSNFRSSKGSALDHYFDGSFNPKRGKIRSSFRKLN